MLEIARNRGQVDMKGLLNLYQDLIEQKAKTEYAHLPLGLAVENAEQDFKAYVLKEFFTNAGAFYAFWQLDGQYVSAARLEPYKDGLLLYSLHTRVDLRRKGYGQSLLRALLETQKGRLYSHVRRSNTPSVRLHEKLGFIKVADSCVYLDGSVDANAITFCAGLR